MVFRWGIKSMMSLLRAAAAASSFTPYKLSPVLWLDGSNPNGTGTPPSNGTSISTLVDMSGNNYHFTQDDGSSQPTFLTNQFNGLGAITFDGAQFLSRDYTAALNDTNMSIFIVVSVAATTGNFRSVLTSRIGTPNTQGYIFYAEAGGNWSFWVGNGGAGTWVENDGAAVTLDELVLLRGFTNVAADSFYVNGTAYDNNPSTSYVANDANVIWLGSGEGGAFGCPMNFGEMIAFDRTLTAVEQSALSSYFSTKWGNGIA